MPPCRARNSTIVFACRMSHTRIIMASPFIWLRYAGLVVLLTSALTFGATPNSLSLRLRSLQPAPGDPARYEPVDRPATWDAPHTAAVICDMWNQHWCQGATARVAEMAPRMNDVIKELRRRGVLIIHCPSGTMKFYEGTPPRKRAQSAPKVTPRVPLQGWCNLDPKREAPLPIDDSDGGCDDEPQCKHPPYPWTRQIATLEIKDGDAITDSAEAYYLMRQRGITNVIVMGVHENMCVLGRPFSIRQMVNQGQNVVLLRDLTDTMYNSRQRPFVDHFTGTDLVAWHIERYWCPTITSDQIVGGKPFRFTADTRAPRQFKDYAYLFTPDGHPADRYNVVWTSPSQDSSGSMPLGNGDIGLNFWVEENGDLLFYLSKSDAWDEKDHLDKLGRVRVRLSPNPFQAGSPFRQELKLSQGEIEVRAGEPDAAITLRAWVDANHPVVHLEAEGEQPFNLQANLEIWRTKERTLSPEEANGVDHFAKDEPPKAYPDQVVTDQADRVIWYHRDERSIWAATLAHQGLAGLTNQFKDPLLHRTFGGTMKSDGLVKAGATQLKSKQAAKHFVLSIYALTAQTPTPQAWLDQQAGNVAAIDAIDLSQARQAHRQWWRDFWNRSWIRVTASGSDHLMARAITPNQFPLRIGADSDGQNRFRGELGRVAVYDRALNSEEITALAKTKSIPAKRPAGCVWEWLFSRGSAGDSSSLLNDAAVPKAVGQFETKENAAESGGCSIQFNGQGYYEIPSAPATDLTNAVTLEAWIKPDQLPPGGGRILDKSKAGTSNGYLLDTYPGNSLRLIVEDGTLTCDAKLPTNRWSHVAAVFDAHTGEKKLYLDGKVVATGGQDQRSRPDDQIVSQGYALQRFINACAGRGGSPIKFNGSIFTVDVPGKFDGDYRRWGGCYWFQNTRLPYWPMLAAGDFDLMQPLFKMYRDALPLARARTLVYYRHDGAFFPETMHWWGAYHNGGMGYGWDRAGEPLGRTVNRYIRFYWSGGLELLAMMLDHFAFTQDRVFLQNTLLPHAEAVLEFYAKHYPHEPSGRILFAPAQSLETWWECENPMPVVAGLRCVLKQLLALPVGQVGEGQMEDWKKLQTRLPPIPRRELAGQPALSPAEAYRSQHNMENPELYAVFPYRHYGVGKPELDMARWSFAHRQFKGNRGWQQDDTQAAFLGLADEARRMVASRFSNKNPGSRFPAFWGPNFDWIPDQDHGANGLMALQTMLLQWDGRKMFLFPAWPKNWDVEFKLHAPFNTTVEGTWRGGRLLYMKVSPPERKPDLVQMTPQ